MEFRWNAWNSEHVAVHGVPVPEAEYLVEHARAPYPERIGDEKYRVRGTTPHGRSLQVIYIFSPADVVYVIHARPLTTRERHALRRRSR